MNDVIIDANSNFMLVPVPNHIYQLFNLVRQQPRAVLRPNPRFRSPRLFGKSCQLAFWMSRMILLLFGKDATKLSEVLISKKNFLFKSELEINFESAK